MTIISKHMAVALLAVAAFTPQAYAADTPLSGFYLEGQMGASFATDGDYRGEDGFAGLVDLPNVDYDNAFTLSGAVGYHVMPSLRLEGEIGYRNHDVNSSEAVLAGVPLGTLDGANDLGVTTYMVNAWYDFTNNSKFTPYIGGGLGAAHLSVKTDSTSTIDSDDSDTVFAYQLGTGVAYALNDNLAFTVGYRYLDTADAKFAAVEPTTPLSGSFEDDFSSHEVKAGLRYSF